MERASKVLDGWGFVTYPQDTKIEILNPQKSFNTLEGWGYVTCPKECPSCPCPLMLPPFLPLQKEESKQEESKALRFIQDKDLDDLIIETCFAHSKPLLKNSTRTRTMDREVKQLGQYQQDPLQRWNSIAIKLLDANVPEKYRNY